MSCQDTGRTALHESLAHGHRGASWALLCHRADPKVPLGPFEIHRLEEFLILRKLWLWNLEDVVDFLIIADGISKIESVVQIPWFPTQPQEIPRRMILSDF